MTTETTPNDATADVAEAATTTALGDAATTEAATDTPAEDGETAGEVTEAEAPDKTEEAPADTIVGAPEEYDASAFTMPEGVEFDTEMFNLVKDDLKGMDLSQKGAEKIIGIFAEKVAPKIAERTTKAIDDGAAQLSANLARDLQADPEVGGAKLKESQAYAAKAIAQFIPDPAARSEFSKFLNESGLGNHPLLTRVIAGAGRALSEASTPGLATEAAEKTASEKFYGRKA